jgi:type II secretory pathway pseudopilin PulG
MNVDDVVQQRIAAARRKAAATKARRAAQQQARDAGLQARHAAKLRHLQETPVIPAIGRQKGGAPLLGAREPGEQGPFGPYGSDDDLEDEQPPDDDPDTRTETTQP